ncbi:gamma-glutamyltransferase [Roseomonas elaeocarpi]|uniref:Glutathione hydrolase proenzyme n=1 Tax=Roseomonas elaeocarpi TaxID=907779 RepID=A0ABV6JXP3_9PROT
MRRPTLLLLAALLLPLPPALAQGPVAAPVAPPVAPPATAGAARPRAGQGEAIVAAAHPMAAEAGMAMIRAGGSAVDAAVAIQAMLALVEPQSSGLGGGAVMLSWDSRSRQVVAWDGRETAPAAADETLFLRDGQPIPFTDAVLSGRSVGVPGAVAMLEAAHKESGRLPWAKLFEPAIKAARDGFKVSARLAGAIAADAERLRRDPGALATFFTAPGLLGSQPLPEGATLRNPALADTLEAIAKDGSAALLRGPIAADIARAVRGYGSGGLMTTDDLAGYAPRRREAVCAPYRVWRVCGFPPPSSGGVAVAQALGLLEHFDLGALRPNSADAAQLIAEAGRLAFADRNQFLADTDFVAVPLPGLIDERYLTTRAQGIDRDRAATAPRAGNPSWRDAVGPAATAGRPAAAMPPQPEHGTSHFIVVDRDGNAVSMTTTVEDSFGARLMVRGFLLNNELTDFSFRPEVDGRPVANRVEGGKRPRSSMSPTLVFDRDGRLVAAAGSAGGARIIGYTLQALVGMLDWKLDPQAALALPHVGTLGSTVELEEGTPAAALSGTLQARGQAVEVRPMPSGSQAVWLSPTGWQGGVDPRREGVVLTQPAGR